MKTFSHLILVLLLVLTSCSNQDLVSPTDLSKGEWTQITVGLDNTAKTRLAYADPTLAGMRLVLFVSYGGKVVYTEDRTNWDGTSTTFNVQLVSDQKYVVSCWADFGGDIYELATRVGEAPTVAMKSFVGSQNNRDAYFDFEDVEFDSEGKKARTIGLTLTRPFSLVRVVTTDYNQRAVKQDFRPTQYTIKLNTPTSMNLATGDLAANTDDVVLGGNVAEYTASGDVPNGMQELSFDYLFAPATGGTVTFEATYTTANGDVTYTFNTIPVKRNFRTNVTGNILTKAGNIDVEVDQKWDGTVTEATNASDFSRDIQAAKDAGFSEFTFRMAEPVAAEVGQTSRTFQIPNDVTGTVVKDVLIDFSKGINTSVVIKDENPENSADNYAGNVTVVMPNNVANNGIVTFNLPKAHVIIKGEDGTVIRELVASTRPTTLVIESGVTVQNLKVSGGNVDVYGKVVNLERTQDNTDAQTVVTIFDGGEVENRGSDSKVKYIVRGDIQIARTGDYYATVQDAIDAAQAGDEILIVSKTFSYPSTIVVNKAVTIKPQVGCSPKFTGTTTLFNLNADGAKIEGLALEITERVNGVAMVTLTKNGSIVNNCSFTGQWELGDSEVLRGVVPNAGIASTVTNNTFRGVRQPGYMEGSGVISGNTVINTNGWVICNNSNYTITNENISCTIPTMSHIAIINNGSVNNYEDICALSSANNGARVKTEAVANNLIAQNGVIITPIYTIRNNKPFASYTDLAAAMNAAANGDVIKLAAAATAYEVGQFTVKAGVKIEGNSGNRAVLKGAIQLMDNTSLENINIEYAERWGTQNGVVYVNGSNVTIKNVEWMDHQTSYNTNNGDRQMWCLMTVAGKGSNLVVDGCKFTGHGGSSKTGNGYYKAIYFNVGLSTSTVTIKNSVFNNIVTMSADAYIANIVCTGNTFPACSVNNGVGPQIFNAAGTTATTSTWSDEFKAMVNQILSQNTWGSNNKAIKITNGDGSATSRTSTL